MSFNNPKKVAFALASKRGVEVKYNDKRFTNVTRLFDELTNDQIFFHFKRQI